MSGPPRTTVMMPAYNAEATLREAVESVLAQTVGDLELIVADNASAIPVDEGFQLGYATMKPGNGPKLHNHDTNETFIAIKGTWRVVWGDSVGTSNFSVFVDATTGEYLETMR